ncbi:MAG: hypothetical protein OD816_001231 [Thermodesulfobacterium sp.]|uniref:Uncharacterized protein n=1 Tax=Candidatus Thermodesulfobacterium syntrophicum TaxID=3060442 RepID=A0AAE3P4V2_9BACT|nr:hypothetical protein [Candidatus Thermodesulfobacterium syntrophicum]
MEFFLILLLIIDIIMIGIFFFFYIRLKKFLELPWEEVRESIEKAKELVERLEKLKPASETKMDLKREIRLLAKKGLTPKEIAKKLELSEAEVELVLASKKNFLKG